MESKTPPKAPLPKIPRLVEDDSTSPKASLPKAPPLEPLPQAKKSKPTSLKAPAGACREVVHHDMQVRPTTDPVTGTKALRIDVKLEVLTSPNRATEFAEMLRYDAGEIEKHAYDTLDDLWRALDTRKVDEE